MGDDKFRPIPQFFHDEFPGNFHAIIFRIIYAKYKLTILQIFHDDFLSKKEA